MIINNRPLSMGEVIEYIKKDKGSETEVIGFIKKFNKLKTKDAQELRKELGSLEIMKMKPENIVKIIDILPENAEELNKIFVDVSLDEDEIKRVLETIKKFK